MKILKYICIVLLCIDVAYTFHQCYYMTPLDGDLAGIVMPAPAYNKVMEDPFGLGVLLHNETYAATNRFFIHWICSGYFKTVPFALQNFTNPVDSIFLSIAVARTTMHIALIYLL